MQWIQQFENLKPWRDEPGNVPLPVLLRNMVFDNVFYDTDCLASAEKLGLLASTFAYEEGGMLLVHPAPAEKEIEYFSASKDLLEAYPALEAVALPGVGSSVIGTAALARQVANVTGQPVAGLITGYGFADMVSEALGGWIDFGTANRVRCMLASWRRQLGLHEAKPTNAELRAKYRIKSTTFLADEPESNTLLNILLRHADKLQLVAAHSKGALNLQNALYAFADQTTLPVEAYEGLTLVTFGCGVTLPARFADVHQFVGTWDMLGRLNTPIGQRDDPSLTWCTGKCHNLRVVNPFHMAVADHLRQVTAGRRVTQPRQGLPASTAPANAAA